MKFLFILCLLFAYEAHAHKIFLTQGRTAEIARVIMDLSPHVGEKNAVDYAIIIDKYSTEYDLNWKIVVAILKQESDFVHGEIDERYRDFGIGQINWQNVKAMEIDLGLLLTDVDYALRQTFMILANLKKKYDTGSTGYWAWYTRYHSFTPKMRRKYYWGRKKSGHDGLRYKFERIERSLKRVGEQVNRRARATGKARRIKQTKRQTKSRTRKVVQNMVLSRSR